MKTKEITEMVPVTYWQCDNPKHRHRSKDVAERCLLKSTNKRVSRWTVELKRAVFICVMNGGSWVAAAKLVGVSTSWCTSQIHKMMRRMKHPSNLTEGMPDHDIYSVVEVRAQKDFWLKQLDKVFPLPDEKK